MDHAASAAHSFHDVSLVSPLGGVSRAAGLGAAVSLVQGLAARLRGDRNSASLSRTA
ncbi:hypothetical protein ACFY7H_19745 [Streptomyces sp. NPDC012794]|uniref:hypothetical protein n=1 Tax=Streptomyces sp. NPDC012794 TaxID=3364850 RepID=UPI00369ABDF1